MKQRIDSILNQTYLDYEVIFLNDASTDNSLDVIQSYLDRFPNLKIISNEENSGSPMGMWEIGINSASGEFIWIAEGDDFCEPNFLERLVPFLISGSCEICFCRSFDFYHENKYFKNKWMESFFLPLLKNDYFIIDGNSFNEHVSRFRCPIVNVSSCVFKKYLFNNWKYKEIQLNGSDWYFWVQIMADSYICYLDQSLNFIRIRDDSFSSLNKNYLKICKDTLIIAKYISKYCNQKFEYDSRFNWLLKRFEFLFIKYKDFSIPFFLLFYFDFSWFFSFFKNILLRGSNKLFNLD